MGAQDRCDECFGYTVCLAVEAAREGRKIGEVLGSLSLLWGCRRSRALGLLKSWMWLMGILCWGARGVVCVGYYRAGFVQIRKWK